MPICIECRYPVPQLYHVLHSTSKSQTQSQIRSQSQSRRSSIANSSASSFHQRRESGGHAGVSNVKSRIAIDGKTEGGGTAGREGDRRGFGEGSKGKGVAGGDVRLTQCPRCKRFADKYVEHDFVVLFIDLVLVKPQDGRMEDLGTGVGFKLEVTVGGQGGERLKIL
ncbi:sterol homeostasis protein [Schaereria dolodes]|nr:sterol homeostasis protein [Schaereria dolodes]